MAEKREREVIAEPPFTSQQALRMQALATGTADAEQQKAALKWIIEDVCELGKWPYRVDERETNIMLGRNFVGHRIVAATNANVSKLVEIEKRLKGARHG